MFLCEKCDNHDKPGDYHHRGSSYGPCEGCGKTNSCTDCKWTPDQAWRDRMAVQTKAWKAAKRRPTSV